MPIQPSILDVAGFWALAAIACALVAWWVLRAAARANPAPPGVAAEIAIYRDQLREVARDHAEGRIPVEALEAARLEIGRRLAKAEARLASDAPAKASLGRGWLLAAAVVPVLLGGGLYLWLGTPGKADQPFAAREAEMLARPPQSLSDQEIIVLLQERARRAPTDAVPHVLLGQVLSGTGRDGDALRAFQAALRRDPRNFDALTEIGATLMRMNNGVADDDARRAFAAAKAIDPAAAAPDFHLALSDWNAGERDKAMQAWRALFARLPAEGPARVTLAARVADRLSAIDRGPDAPGADALAKAGPAEREAFIASMVEARAARFAQTPGDLAARLSLARVRAVTGQRDVALALLDPARAGGDAFEAAVLRLARDMLPQSQPVPAPPPAGMPKR